MHRLAGLEGSLERSAQGRNGNPIPDKWLPNSMMQAILLFNSSHGQIIPPCFEFGSLHFHFLILVLINQSSINQSLLVTD